MAVTLTKVGKTPGQTQFGLDTFTEHYKTDTTADDVLTDPSVPQKGSAHPDYAFMFVTDRHVQETGPSASALDLIYMGCLTDDGVGGPNLPPSQATDDDSVMSASASKSATGLMLTSPLSVQFYAPTSNLSWITYNAKGSKTDVPDPAAGPNIITIALADTSFAGTAQSIGALVAAFFSTEIVSTIRCQELVTPGKFYLNQGKKISHFVPYIFNLSPGFYPVVYAGGTGYVGGDSISINSGGVCSMTVNSVYANYGQISGISIVSNAMTIATGTPIAATGGSGSGATFTVIEIT